MLSIAEDHLRNLNPQARLEVFGQELNAETYAMCRSDMMLKGQDASHIAYGNSFSEDHHEGEHFDYLLANPPFGVEWKKVESEVRREHETKGFAGRFGAGLPRITDGSFLFLQHMIKLLFDQFEESWVGDGELADQAQNNSLDNFRLVFERKFLPTINPNLGDRRPLDLIRRGQAREVLDAISSERAGSFA